MSSLETKPMQKQSLATLSDVSFSWFLFQTLLLSSSSPHLPLILIRLQTQRSALHFLSDLFPSLSLLISISCTSQLLFDPRLSSVLYHLKDEVPGFFLLFEADVLRGCGHGEGQVDGGEEQN